MATVCKNVKDKPHSGAPRLPPRPTAASAARAARNATNRNLAVHLPRQSPTRPPLSPKSKPYVHHNIEPSDSKISMKSNQASVPEYDHLVLDHFTNNAQGMNGYVTEGKNSSILIIEDAESNKHEKLTDNYDSSRNCKSAHNSRPQTPNHPLSRPNTPRMPSRPTTPARSTPVRPTTPASRPTTPMKQISTSRPRTPAHSAHSRALPGNQQSMNNADLKTTFITKQKQFQQMKKELDLKQQAILEVFENIRRLKDQLVHEGLSEAGESAVPQELVIFNVGNWAAEEVTQLCRDAAAAAASGGEVTKMFCTSDQPDEKYLEEISMKITDMPAQFANLCIQAFTARQEIIDWIKDLVSLNENGGKDELEKIGIYNAQGLELCEALRELKIRADLAVDTASQFSKRTYQEKNALIAAGETLIREISKLRTDIENQNKNILNIREGGEGVVIKALEETRRELEEEKAAKAALKEKLSVTESQLRTARMRVTKMDRQLREAEASIASLTSTVKSLEEQSRQREVQLEARARKLRDSLKTGEVTSSQLVQQRDALHAEIQELKETMLKLTTQNKSTVHDLTEQLNAFKCTIQEQSQKLNKEMEEKREVQEGLIESRKHIEELNMKINELENNKPNPDLPSEREMDLWAELQATKESLRMTEEEMNTCKREKVRFLETLTKITESDNKVGMQQKLAAELMSKEEIIAKMQCQVRELAKNTKLNEQKVMQYEQFVRDLQAHNRSIANNDDIVEGPTYQDLQQEVMNLRMTLVESGHRNEELQEMLMQKEQQLDQQDKTSRSQAKVIKVREELINMLKTKETTQSNELTALQRDLEHRMKIVDDVNKQIAAKADEIQELFATLETKQQQIHRLEKIVLALEDQQRRAQAQRVRNEEKIAALEHELAGGGNRKERRFIFF